MIENLTEIVDEFQFKKEKFRIIKINRKKIVDEILIQNLGNEFLTYLAKEGDDNYNKELSNSSYHYCLDLSVTEYLSSAFYGKLVSLTKKHKENKNKELALSKVDSKTDEIFKLTRLNGLFNLFKDNEDYKKNIERYLSS